MAAVPSTPPPTTPDSTKETPKKKTGTAGRAARRGDEAANRAKMAALEAERLAYHTKKEASGATHALQKTLNSPMKSCRPGTSRAFQTKPSSTADFTQERFVRTNTGSAAIKRLANGEPHVEFPSVSLTLEDVPTLCEAVNNNKNLQHLDLKRAIPVNGWVEQLMDTLEGNESIVFLGLAENQIGFMHVEEPKMGALNKLKTFIDSCESIRCLNLAGNLFGAAGTELICQGVRENVSLRTVDLSGNLIATSPDDDEEAAAAGMEALREVLTKNKFLKTLTLQSNDLVPENIEAIQATLEVTHRLTSLDLANNKLGTPGATMLGKMLAKNKGLKLLDVSNNAIGWKGIHHLVDPLVSNNSTLQSLFLQKNKFGCFKPKKVQKLPDPEEEPEEVDPEELEERKKAETLKTTKEIAHTATAMKRIGDVLAQNKSVTNIDLAFNSIGPMHIPTITVPLQSNTTLTSLNLEMNHICGCTPGELECDGIEAIAAMLKANSTLKTLKLKWNFLQAEGAQLLSEALRVNSGLTSLDIARNFMGDIGCDSIAKALKKNGTLLSLNLANNGIGHHGAGALAEMISSNTTLTSIDLQDNDIDTQGFQPLSAAITQSATLQCVDFTRCGIGHCSGAIGKLFSTNTSLKTFEMADNPVDLSTISAAVEALKGGNKTLTVLSMWGRHGETDPVAQAALGIDLLENNPNIVGLDLGWSKVDGETMATIEALLQRNGAK
eukprot:TRINITY_DN58604_c0_g1_i1.p1 TRINITY_DN58604_c0_g1~~TRINITY_DN58604_c0_g1_i1.p1  ORF type:complete len:723 (+),score=58.73 TRINITY_DN58604_c0_g1_i1:59-2227(+)